MNYPFIRSVIGGTWHVNASTYLELVPLRNLILSGVQFDKGEAKSEELMIKASSLPYYIAAEDYYRFSIETAPDSGKYVSVTVLSGPMTRHDQYCGPVGTQSLVHFMEQADNNKKVVGQILYVDSGGGQTISLDPFMEAFPDFKKPVLGFVENMAASAGYGAISFCKEIYASKSKSVLGSIGTMLSFDANPANSTSSDGIKHVRLYATKSVNKNGDFEEALKGNYKPLIDNTLNPINEDFIAMIRSNRSSVTENLCDGSDHFAEDVVGSLIDGVQSFEATMQRVIALSQDNSDSNHNSQNQHKLMANTNPLAALAAVAGYPTLEVDKSGHISMQQAAAEKVDANLQKVTAILAAKEKAEADLTAANSTIAELRSKITELEKKPGASSATVKPSSDDPKVDSLIAFSTDSDSSLEDMLNAFEKSE